MFLLSVCFRKYPVHCPHPRGVPSSWGQLTWQRGSAEEGDYCTSLYIFTQTSHESTLPKRQSPSTTALRTAFLLLSSHLNLTALKLFEMGRPHRVYNIQIHSTTYSYTAADKQVIVIASIGSCLNPGWLELLQPSALSHSLHQCCTASLLVILSL